MSGVANCREDWQKERKRLNKMDVTVREKRKSWRS
jgi:hypothetical protein